MITTSNTQAGMALLLAIAAFIIIRSLLKRSRLPVAESNIDLDMLVLEWNPLTQRYEMSIIRVLALAAFALTAWVMVYQTLSARMTEGYLGLFNIMWVSPLLAAIIWGKRPPTAVPGPTTTIAADSVTVKQ